MDIPDRDDDRAELLYLLLKDIRSKQYEAAKHVDARMAEIERRLGDPDEASLVALDFTPGWWAIVILLGLILWRVW